MPGTYYTLFQYSSQIELDSFVVESIFDSVAVVPNPTPDGYITVDYFLNYLPQTPSVISVEITDNMSNVVYDYDELVVGLSGSIPISINHLVNGIYYLKVDINGNTYSTPITINIIKQN